MTEFQPGCPARTPPCPLGWRLAQAGLARPLRALLCRDGAQGQEEQQDQPSVTHSTGVLLGSATSPATNPGTGGAGGGFYFIPKAGFAWWMSRKSGPWFP